MKQFFSLVLMASMAIAGCGDDGGNSGTDGGTFGKDGGVDVGNVALDSIAPDHGPLLGGTEITLRGSGFVLANAGDNRVVIGEQLATSVTTVDDTTVRVTVPAGVAPGSVSVFVFNANGYSTLTAGYSYNAIPTITDIQPPRGDRKGGDTITITGSGFADLEAGTNAIVFGASPAGSVTVVSDTELTVTAPPGPPFEFVDVALTNANGAAQVDDGYSYSAQGLIAAAAISWGNTNGNSGVYFVDVETGLSTRLFIPDVDGSVSGAVGLATAADGTIYASTTRTLNGTHFLTKFTPFSTALEVIGPITQPAGPTNLGGGGGTLPCSGLSFFNDVLYCAARNTLYTLDLATGAATLVTILPDFGHLGLVLEGGSPLVSSRNNLRTIDTSTWSVGLPVAVTTVDGYTSNSLTYHGGKLYGTFRSGGSVGGGGGAPGDGRIMSIDATTGAVTPITQIPAYLHALTSTTAN